MSFRHLDYAATTAITTLGPAALDDLLDRGDLETWAPVAGEIVRDPWGATATTILRLCDAHPMYGTSALWRHWIDRRRFCARERPALSLAAARARTSMTQTQVAHRLEIAQADVSKLERRADLRLSSLQAYARALGGALEVSIRLPGDIAATPIAIGEQLASP